MSIVPLDFVGSPLRARPDLLTHPRAQLVIVINILSLSPCCVPLGGELVAVGTMVSETWDKWQVIGVLGKHSRGNAAERKAMGRRGCLH